MKLKYKNEGWRWMVITLYQSPEIQHCSNGIRTIKERYTLRNTHACVHTERQWGSEQKVSISLRNNAIKTIYREWKHDAVAGRLVSVDGMF